MKHRRNWKWWAIMGVIPVLMWTMAIICKFAGPWDSILNTGVAFIGGMVWMNAAIWSFGSGWVRGVKDAVEGFEKAETPEEFVRLMMVSPPKPWS